MENTNQIKAIVREKKKRQKMAVHGRGVKSLPSGGVIKAARRVRTKQI
ncbi:MAG: hypothetical protein Q7S48_00685 [bacterium]|nr:hypothetical protein [bacterium]